MAPHSSGHVHSTHFQTRTQPSAGRGQDRSPAGSVLFAAPGPQKGCLEAVPRVVLRLNLQLGQRENVSREPKPKRPPAPARGQGSTSAAKQSLGVWQTMGQLWEGYVHLPPSAQLPLGQPALGSSNQQGQGNSQGALLPSRLGTGPRERVYYGSGHTGPPREAQEMGQGPYPQKEQLRPRSPVAERNELKGQGVLARRAGDRGQHTQGACHTRAVLWPTCSPVLTTRSALGPSQGPLPGEQISPAAPAQAKEAVNLPRTNWLPQRANPGLPNHARPQGRRGCGGGSGA